MLAAVYHGANDLRVEQVPLPAIGEHEVLLRVESASICGTDLRILHGDHRKYPEGTIRIPGHEVVGTVEKVGDRIGEAYQGRRFFVAPNIGCGTCRQCVSGHNNLCANYDALGITMDGAFAGYMRVPEAALRQGNLIPVADGLDPAVSALTEPFACVLHGQDALDVKPGDVVLVMGAGPIGMLHARLAKLRGASRVLVSEPLADRRAQAARMGADRVIDPTTEDLGAVVNEESRGQGADVVIVAAPAHQAQESALRVAAIGGRVNFFGGLPKNRPTVNLDSNLVHYKELRVTGTTGCSTQDCWRAAEIVNSRRIDLADFVSARFALKDAYAAFEAAANRKSLKVVIQP